MNVSRWRVENGDARAVLAELPDRCVQTCVTSPPYWGLRDYEVEPVVWAGKRGCRHEWERSGHSRPDDALGRYAERPHVSGEARCRRCGAWRGCLGLEQSLDLYVAHIVELMRAVRRVLRDDGTLWLVLGDAFATGRTAARLSGGLKPKDLLGIPWRVAMALQADGWLLRSDVVWAKPNPMPESVRDRPTRAHEYVFLLARQPRYFYDHVAVREKDVGGRTRLIDYRRPERLTHLDRRGPRGQVAQWTPGRGRNRRSVWWIPTRGCPGGHIATFPERLVEPCVLAGTSPTCCGVCGSPWERHDGSYRPSCSHLDDSGRCLVLDPFCGSGTVGRVACRHGRAFLGIDLSARYVGLARRRIEQVIEERNTGVAG